VRNDQNQVYAGPCEVPSQRVDYDFEMPEPEDIQAKIASCTIAAGLKNPNSSEGTMEILRLIPKKKVPPLLPKAPGTEGWGLHAIQGWSLFKILAWYIATQVLGLVFFSIWLGFVNKTDLQNAFIPLTFFTTSFMVGFGICQFFTTA
jgi:hypothetical protein